MKTFGITLVPVTLGLLLMAWGIGCGGGGGNGAPVPLTPTQLHGGAYFYNALSGNFGGPSTIAWWGDYVSDGAGMVTGGTLNANNAGGTGTAPILPYAYTVSATHRMTWAAGTPTQQSGGLASDGRVAVLQSTANAAFPTLAVAVRKSGAFSTASLNGTFHAFGMYRTGASVVSIWGTATFDGAGNLSYSLTQNFDGAVGGSLAPAGNYTVAADGTVDLDFGTADLRGGMLAGGAFVAVCGTINPAAPQMMMVFFPQATAASTATLGGSYHYVRLYFEHSGPPHYRTRGGVLNADGIGTLTIPAGATSNIDGVIGPTAAATAGGYAVGADGTITLSGGAGAVSPSGAFAFIGGPTAGGSDPELWILVR